MRDVISGCTYSFALLLKFRKKLFYQFMFFKNLFIRLSLCLYVFT